MEVVKSTKVPTEGEWVMSTMPERFTIVVKNNGPFFAGHDRLAIMVKNHGVVGEGDATGRSKFSLGITGIRALDGQFPGEDLTDSPEARLYCNAEGFEKTVSGALDLWAENTTQEERMEVWMAGSDISKLLESLLG